MRFHNEEERVQNKIYLRKLVANLDKDIVYRYRDLLSRYKDTIDKYHFITNYLIFEIIYPRVLRREHKVDKAAI